MAARPPSLVHLIAETALENLDVFSTSQPFNKPKINAPWKTSPAPVVSTIEDIFEWPEWKRI